MAVIAIELPPLEPGDPIEYFAWGSAALISDTHLLTAAHVFDLDGPDHFPDGVVDNYSDTFVALFPDGDAFQAYPIDLGTITLAPNWPDSIDDIAVISMPSPIADRFARYSIYGGDDEVGKPVVIAGYGEQGHGATGAEYSFDPTLELRAGLNRIEDVGQFLPDDTVSSRTLAFDFDSGQPEHNSFQLAGIPSDRGFGGDEVMIASGDSGGPVFLNGSIAGVSIASLNLLDGDATPEVDSSWGEFGIAMRVSGYQDFLFSATGGGIAVTPEPLASFLLASTLAPLSAHRLRGRRLRDQQGQLTLDNEP